MSQPACFTHVVQYVHVGTVEYMRARNGSGQIQLIGPGHYRVRISAGKDPVTGKRRQLSKVVHGTRQDAERARAELLLESGGDCEPGSELLLRDLVARHLDAPTRSWHPRAPYSRHREHRRFMSHVNTQHGSRTADGIKPQELTVLYDSVLAKGLKPSSVQLVHGLVCAAYSWGNRRGFVSSNPAKFAECPTARMEPPRSPSMESVKEHLEILQEEDQMAPPPPPPSVTECLTTRSQANEIPGTS